MKGPSYIMYFSTYVALSSYSPLVPMCIQALLSGIMGYFKDYQHMICKHVNKGTASLTFNIQKENFKI